jgi:adenosine deaminase
MADLRRLPKVDLHRHLVGSIRPEVLVQIAASLNIALDDFANDPSKIKSAAVLSATSTRGYEEFFKRRVWKFFKPIFRHPQGAREAIYHAIADAAHDGVIYVEFRVSPYGIGPEGPGHLAAFLSSLGEGIRRASQDFPETLAKLILSIGRHRYADLRSHAERQTMCCRLIDAARAFNDFVVGFDIAGDEENYPNELFVDLAKAIKSAGFKLTVHAGETNNAHSMWDALQCLAADRIGHGLAAVTDAKLVRYLAMKHVPLEMCPTSNYLLGTCKSLDDYPLRSLLQAGVITTVNTDDPVLFNETTLSREFYSLLEHGQIEATDVQRICDYSVDASFASDRERLLLKHKIGAAGLQPA